MVAYDRCKAKDDKRFARHGDDLVMLDIAGDAYFMAPGAGRLMRTGADGCWVIDDADVADLLGARAGEPLGPAASLHGARAVRGLVLTTAPIGLGDLLAFATAAAIVVFRFNGVGLSDILAAARPRGGKRPPVDEGRLARAVDAFYRLLVFAPRQGVCLYRSFFLLQFLRARGLDARWVFGVRSWPFRAHCWLQAEDLVLDDSLDHVAAFTPILTV